MKVHCITDTGRNPQVGDLVVDSHGNVMQYTNAYPPLQQVDPELAEEACKAVVMSLGGGVGFAGQAEWAQHQTALDCTPFGRTAKQLAELAENPTSWGWGQG